MEFLHESFKLDFWMANQSCCVTLAGSLAFHSFHFHEGLSNREIVLPGCMVTSQIVPLCRSSSAFATLSRTSASCTVARLIKS